MDEHDKLIDGLFGGMRQAQAILAEAMTPERYEYRLVGWSQVNELARDGWTLVPMNEGHEFVMQRKLTAADAAAELLAKPEPSP